MIKIDIISGFLGSGKTTLIKKLLKACDEQKEKIVLIENEFGEVGIDGELVKREGFEVFEISKGCVCCSMKNDFIFTLSQIIEKIKPDRILFEPSGIFVPTEILSILKTPDFSTKCILNSLISVVDSVNFIKQSFKYTMFFEKQIESANLIILSKVQLIEPNQVDEIIRKLKKINSNALIVTQNWQHLSSSDLLNLLRPALSEELNDPFSMSISGNDELEVYSSAKSHNEEFDTLSINTSQKYDEKMLSCVLEKLHSPSLGEVLRAKGFLPAQSGCLEFSYVDGDFTIDINQFVSSGKVNIIGKNLDKNSIRELFIKPWIAARIQDSEHATCGAFLHS